MLSEAKHLSIPNGTTSQERSFAALRMTKRGNLEDDKKGELRMTIKG